MRYELRFEPNLERSKFQGRVVIEVIVDGPTNEIVMNSAELIIQNCTVTLARTVIGSHVRLRSDSEELVIRLTRRISGRIKIALDFTGILNDRLLGFYSSVYKVGKINAKIATSQFEAADARRAFPCWDNPLAKAKFDVVIVAPNNMRAVSNMPIIKTKNLGGKCEHTFMQTPLMSTYLLYIGVGDFESISCKYRGIKISVIATRGNVKHGKFALGLTKKLLAEYERYFGIKYPLPKLDLLAIPDFAAGAMENWGAITFRETLLLYDEKKSSTRTKQLIAEVVSHELAHQWFGNLVTMKWWNDLWLNESFATFMGTKFVHKLYPAWAMWDQFAEDTVNTALRLDSLKSTHPIDVKVTSPAQIREIFDAISYDKGGAVLQMIERIVGESVFKRGLQTYLRKFAYKNATGTDLWRIIGKSAHKNITPFVRSWITQAGYPLLDVTRRGNTVNIRQSRFFLELPCKRNTQTWKIPVFIGKQKSSLKIFSNTSFTLKGLAVNDVLNPSRAAFIRVRYGTSQLNELQRMASVGKLKSFDIWMIQNDILALCRAGLCDVCTYLDFVDSCTRDQSYLVSSSIARNLRFLHRISFGTSFEWRLRERSRDQHVRMFARLGWTPQRNEHHIDSILRAEVISTLGNMLKESVIIKEANTRFEKFVRKNGSLVTDLRQPVISIAVSSGGVASWNRAKSLYTLTDSQEEKTMFLSAMCATTSVQLLRKTLDYSQTRHVRSQNMHIPVMRIAANPYGSSLVWPWVKKNWSGISNKVGRGNPLLSRIISTVAISSIDSKIAIDLGNFFSRRKVPGTERTVKQTAEGIRINSGLYERMKREFEISI